MSQPLQQPGRAARRPIILLVEDNPRDVRLVREAFTDRQIDCELLTASDGEHALRMLRHEGEHAALPTPDLVLLDINLPIVNGIEVLDAVKSDPDLRVIPVLILSTSSADTDVLRCYGLHANSYLVKPADFDDFSNMIAQVQAFWFNTALPPPSNLRADRSGIT
jgi:two-component system, chemotaxis family, response regulator Rcp1